MSQNVPLRYRTAFDNQFLTCSTTDISLHDLRLPLPSIAPPLLGCLRSPAFSCLALLSSTNCSSTLFAPRRSLPFDCTVCQQQVRVALHRATLPSKSRRSLQGSVMIHDFRRAVLGRLRHLYASPWRWHFNARRHTRSPRRSDRSAHVGELGTPLRTDAQQSHRSSAPGTPFEIRRMLWQLVDLEEPTVRPRDVVHQVH